MPQMSSILHRGTRRPARSVDAGVQELRSSWCTSSCSAPVCLCCDECIMGPFGPSVNLLEPFSADILTSQRHGLTQFMLRQRNDFFADLLVHHASLTTHTNPLADLSGIAQLLGRCDRQFSLVLDVLWHSRNGRIVGSDHGLRTQQAVDAGAVNASHLAILKGIACALLNPAMLGFADVEGLPRAGGVDVGAALGVGHFFVVAALATAAQGLTGATPEVAVPAITAVGEADDVCQFVRHGVVDQVIPACVQHHVAVEAHEIAPALVAGLSCAATTQIKADLDVGHLLPGMAGFVLGGELGNLGLDFLDAGLQHFYLRVCVAITRIMDSFRVRVNLRVFMSHEPVDDPGLERKDGHYNHHCENDLGVGHGVCSLGQLQLLCRINDAAFPAQLSLLEIRQEVIRHNAVGNNVLAEAIVVLFDLPAHTVHDDVNHVALVYVLNHVVVAALGLPVLGALAFTVPIVGAVVFHHLGLDQQLGHLVLLVSQYQYNNTDQRPCQPMGLSSAASIAALACSNASSTSNSTMFAAMILW